MAIVTDGSESLPGIGDSQPVSLHHLVTHPTERDRAKPHDSIRQCCKRARAMYVELQYSGHILWKVSHHCKVSIVVTDLRTNI